MNKNREKSIDRLAFNEGSITAQSPLKRNFKLICENTQKKRRSQVAKMNGGFGYNNPTGSIKNFHGLRVISYWAGCFGLVS